MFVACSTLSFGRRSFEDALDSIGELGFGKFDVAIREKGPHLKPSEVAQDVYGTVPKLRPAPGLSPGAFSVQFDAANAETEFQQLEAICQLARLSSVPLISVQSRRWAQLFDREVPEQERVPRALEAEVARLKPWLVAAKKEGVLLTVVTEMGTLLEQPSSAVELCEALPGLGLTLDPSHYLAGPFQGDNFEQVIPHVRHVYLRDSGRKPERFQVRIGQGEIEYGKLVSQLTRVGFKRLLTIDIHDIADAPYSVFQEVRKLKYLLESLI